MRDKSTWQDRHSGGRRAGRGARTVEGHGDIHAEVGAIMRDDRVGGHPFRAIASTRVAAGRRGCTRLCAVAWSCYRAHDAVSTSCRRRPSHEGRGIATGIRGDLKKRAERPLTTRGPVPSFHEIVEEGAGEAGAQSALACCAGGSVGAEAPRSSVRGAALSTVVLGSPRACFDRQRPSCSGEEHQTGHSGRCSAGAESVGPSGRANEVEPTQSTSPSQALGAVARSWVDQVMSRRKGPSAYRPRAPVTGCP